MVNSWIKLLNGDLRLGSNVLKIFDQYPQFKKHLSIPFGIGFDGVKIYNSSKIQLWPLFLTNLLLSPDKRKKMKYMPLMCVWTGSPLNFNIYLHFILKDMMTFLSGVIFDGKIVHSLLLWVVNDLDAKAKYLDINLHRGYNGCVCCNDVGVYSHGAVRYPYNRHMTLRSLDEVLNGREGNLQSFRQRSILEDLPYFNLLVNNVIDGMHLFCCNIFPDLFDLWFGSNNDIITPDYYIKDKLKSIEHEIDKIKLPVRFGRDITNLKTTKDWKAEQWGRFFCVLSLPVLLGTLPDKYWNHLKLLVDSYLILIGVDKTHSLEQSLMICSLNLEEFVELYSSPNYYGIRNAKITIHLLLHVTNQVEEFGYLPVHWMFMTESLQGSLKRLCRETTLYFPERMCFVFQLLQCVDEIGDFVNIDDFTLRNDQEKWKEGIMGKRFPLNSVVVCDRINYSFWGARYCGFDGKMYHSKYWKKGKSNSCFFETKLGSFYRINKFLLKDDSFDSDFIIEARELALLNQRLLGFQQFMVKRKLVYLNSDSFKRRIGVLYDNDDTYLVQFEM